MVLEVVGGGSLTNGDGSRFVTDVAAVLVAVLSSMPVCLSVCLSVSVLKLVPCVVLPDLSIVYYFAQIFRNLNR